ncbi:hypothetical protein [Ureibacillus sp. GCM10028918]|uniref:hypothetical protein n=1 Tax=Ureibacillus sp. GCM10028918 TaxID=3273429 RepID=UPI003619511D
MKKIVILLSIFCSLGLAACNNNQEAIEEIEIHEMINFEEEKPNTQQIISDAKDVRILEKVFNKARELGDFEDNRIPPQYKVKLGNKQYYLWVDATETGTIATIEDRSFFYNIGTSEEFKEIINFQGQK